MSFFTPSSSTKGEVGLTSFRNALGENYLAHSRDYVEPPTQIIEAKKGGPLPKEAAGTQIGHSKKRKKIHNSQGQNPKPAFRFHTCDTGKGGANPQLSSVELTSHQELVFPAYTIVHSNSALGHDASTNLQLKLILENLILRICYLNNKLEDLSELVKNIGNEAMDLDSPEDDPPRLSLSEDEEEIQTEPHTKTKYT
ncbi:hypothetical protein Tco_1170300 [Tanacetum coccineum]